MARLNKETIQQIEEYLNRKTPIEIHIEKEQVVVVELSRKVVLKQPAAKDNRIGF